MLTAKPFVSRALRRLGFDTHYRRHGDVAFELEPACESERSAAVFDEDDLRRVSRPAPHTTLEQQVALLRAGRYRHPARLVYRLRNAVMVDGHLFTSKVVHPMGHRPLSSIGIIPSQAQTGVLGTSEYGNKYFGHWFCDDIPMSSTARRFGEVYGHINADNRLIGHQQAYADLFGWNIHLVENAFFKELLILDWSPPTPYQAERFTEMRKRLPISSEPRRNPGVFLLRGATGQPRVLANEIEIAEMTARRGFRVIDPAACSVAEIVEACADARVVVGVEGSQLAHAFLPMARGGTLLTLQPPFKFDHFWKGRCDCMGTRYAFIVGTQTGEAGFAVEVSRVERMLDRLETSTFLT